MNNEAFNGLRVFVVDNGFVFVGHGDAIKTDHGNVVIINRAHNIRKWGTSLGIGELRGGPTIDTVFDPCGVVTVPINRLVFSFATANWKI